MAYTNEPVNRVVDQVPAAVVEYHDRVRWGPILAGLAVALSSQLVLTALGAAIGATGISASDAPRSNADAVGTAVGIWSILSLFISLFIGGYITSRSCGPINKNTALLNGAILWAATLVASSWLLSSGVSGAFGILANNAGEIANQVQQGSVDLPNSAPNVTAQQAQDIAGNIAKAGWAFTLGSLLGLAAAMIGSAVGTRSRSAHTERYVDR